MAKYLSPRLGRKQTNGLTGKSQTKQNKTERFEKKKLNRKLIGMDKS